MAEIRLILDRIGAATIREDEPTLNTPFTSEAVVSNIEGENKTLLVKFQSLPNQYKYSKLLGFWIGGGESSNVALVICAAEAEDTDINIVTWATKPRINNSLIGGKYIPNSGQIQKNDSISRFPSGTWPTPGGGLPVKYNDAEASQAARKAVQTPVIAITVQGSYSGRIGDAVFVERTQTDGLYGDTPFKLNVYIDDSVTIASQVAAKDGTPKSGYIDPRLSQKFEWDFVSADSVYTCAAKWQQTSATFYWRNSNSGAYTAISMGTANSYTIPANTLAKGVFEWYVEATDDTGNTTQSSVYTLSTADALFTATPIRPINVVEDGSAAIHFVWEEHNDTGTIPNGADLQWSLDLQEWNAIGSATGAETTLDSAPDLLPAGTVYWRVRAYNQDGVPGEWSQPVNFVVMAAPPAPAVSVTAVPFATIAWQNTGQQAYRVTIDGRVYGPFFGFTKTFTAPDYLADGNHTASVEVLGQFGLWSAPGTVSFSVQNQPGDPITLQGTFYRDADLSWETNSQTADFLIYRDGVQIGHASGNSFADRTVLGAHSWQVINRLPGGYYTASNPVQGDLQSCGTAIALLAGGEWLELKKTDSESSEQNITVSQQISLRHFEGSIYPEAEVSPYIDQAGSYLVAWTYEEQDAAAAFEAMLGCPVILKARGNECTVGIMASYAKRLLHFYKSYSFSLQRIHWEDFIDEND